MESGRRCCNPNTRLSLVRIPGMSFIGPQSTWSWRMLIKRLLTSGVWTNIMPEYLVFWLLWGRSGQGVCLAQHFSSDIPPMPLMFTALPRTQAREIGHIFTGRGWEREDMGSGGRSRQIFQQTGDIGSHRFPFWISNLSTSWKVLKFGYMLKFS